MVRDTVLYVNKLVTEQPNVSILVEGANATLLDIDFGWLDTFPT